MKKSIKLILLSLIVSCSQVEHKAGDGFRVPNSTRSHDSAELLKSSFYDSVEKRNKYFTPITLPASVTDLQVHTNGESGFFKKLDIIENAIPGKTLELAFFIYEDDYSSSFMTRKIIEASERGVVVNLLVDYFMSVKRLNFFSFLNSHENINVKRFRPASKDFLNYLMKDLEVQEPHLFLDGIALQNPQMILGGLSSSPQLRTVLKNIKKIVAIKDGQDKLTAEELDQYKTLLIQKLLIEDTALEGGVKLVKMRLFLKDYLRRLHHKTVSAITNKGHEFIIGGRNVSDEYHIGLDELSRTQDNLLEGRQYPFLDSEVSGVIKSLDGNKEFSDSFKRLWDADSDLYRTPKVISTSSVIYLEERKKMIDNSLKFEKHLDRLMSRVNQGRIKGNPSTGFSVKYSENLYDSAKEKKEILKSWSYHIEEMKPEDGKIQIISAYLYLYPEMINSLVVANKKGVDIEFYTNSITTTDLNMVNLGAYKEFESWLSKFTGKGKVNFYELALKKGAGSLHAKIMKTGDIVSIGSANMDPRSYLGDTNNVLFIDFSDNPSLGEEVFSAYLNHPERIPWKELTKENASHFLKYAKEDPASVNILKALEVPFIQDQI